MTLDEAIRHAEKVAERQMQKIDNLSDIPRFGSSDEDIKLIENCEKCAEQHRQLAEWLRDYKRLKEKTEYCKDCKHFEYDSLAIVDGIPLIVAHEICNKWGDGCKTKEDGYCFLFEPKESEVRNGTV